MSKQILATAALTLAAAQLASGAALARDNIQIAGSSTVLPYASIVAEAFAENFDHPTPVVESGGSSAGLKKFCEGVGENRIDIANASRPIKASEIETCAANGVDDIIEVRIGYDGIVFASRKTGPAFDAFTPADLFLALAAQLPVDGKLAANPNASWAQVNPALPDVPITAFIPGTKHGTREVFTEKVLTVGCETSGTLAAYQAAGLSPEDAAAACTAVRTDGRSVDIDGDYTETLARLDTTPDAIGVFGLSFYESNTDKLKVATISGIAPSTRTIADGSYPVSRPLFFYLKAAHVPIVPGLLDYAGFFVSDEMAGPDGHLAQYGLVPDPELAATQAAIAARQETSAE